MVGREDENRAAEPLLVLVAFEEAAEGHVVVGNPLVDAGVALGKRVGVLFGHDEGVVRREGEERGEEGLARAAQLLAREAQEGLVPDAPVSVEIPLAVGRLVILAADEPLDAGRAGVGPEAHRTVLRAAEEERLVAPVESMAGSWRLRPSAWGISTKGVLNEGMLPSTEGSAWMERVPLA